MEETDLELRMMGFVPYQLANTIHAGIQFGHAVIEYSINNNNPILYHEWATMWKTFIVLNGGSSSNMVVLHNELTLEDIEHHVFYEPDLNDMLSGIAFIVDERVFNKKKYPDYLTCDENGQAITNYNDWVDYIGENNVFMRKFLSDKRLI
jgi:hypothetical protein